MPAQCRPILHLRIEFQTKQQRTGQCTSMLQYFGPSLIPSTTLSSRLVSSESNLLQLTQNNPTLLLFCFIVVYFPKINNNMPFLQKTSSEGEWSVTVAEFVRHNDQVLVEASSKVLSHYQEELLPISSLMEFCDVVGKLYPNYHLIQFMWKATFNYLKNIEHITK